MKKFLAMSLMTFASSGFAQAEVTAKLVSRDAAGNSGNGQSTGASLSADGRLVAFVSKADNLVVGDTNTESDVFVKNLDTGEIVRVNENEGETPGEGFRNSGEISADGRFVAFTSGVDDRASPGGGVSADVLVKNLETGITVRVNENVDGEPLDEDGHQPSISAAGRFIAFEVSEITSGFGDDIYVKDIETGGLVRVNEDAKRVRLEGFNSLPRISADGSIVAFENFVINQNPTLTLYSKNVVTGEIVVVNRDVAGEQSVSLESGHEISGDGRLVVFSTTARLVTSDTDERRDGYVRNLDTGEVVRFNETADGSAGNGEIDSPYISSDGRFVVFRSTASNLVPDDDNDLADLFVKVLATGEIVRISIENANGAAEFSGLATNATGRFVAFDTHLAGLVPDDTDDQSDVFLIDTADMGPTTPGNLRVIVRSPTEAEVLWERSSDLGGIGGYEITRNGVFVGLLDTLSIVASDLQPGVGYTYSVTAVDVDSNRSATATVNFMTDGSAPSTPENLRFQVYSRTAAEVSWDRSSDDVVVQGYEIKRNDELIGTRDVLGVFDEDLVPGTLYTYSITAIDNDGIRSNTATISFSTDGTGPSKPGDLRFQVYSDTAAEIFWDRSSSEFPVRGYEIVRNGEQLDVRDATSFFDDGLVPGERYSYAVTAIDDEGNRSATASVSLLADVRIQPSSMLPSMPRNLRSRVYSETAADVFWDRSSDDGFVQGYEILRNDELIGTLDTQGVFEDDLVPGVNYVYQVTAIDNDGNRSATATTTLVTAPAPPSALRADVYSATAAEIFWNRPSATGLTYEIVRNGLLVDRIDGVSFFDDQLRAGTTYQYQIKAIGPGDKRSAPAIITLTTLPDG